MAKVNAKFFMAANSAEGFVSYFDRCYDPAAGWRAYVIKGGPGTGKSSFMKRVIKRAAEKGIAAEEIYCASDPASLDGVILPTLKTVILDGTSPHVVEPRCPGACERLLDFGSFWDEKKLIDNIKPICELSLRNKELHKGVGRLVVAAGSLMEDELDKSLPTLKGVKETADAVAEKYLIKNGGRGRRWLRFSRGVTPRGLLRITESSCFENNITLEGSAAFGSGVIELLKNTALDRGYEVVVLKDPILPTRLNDGLVIPELSLFIRGPERLLGEKTNDLIEGAAELLRKAKENHDELEKRYIETMDFGALDRFCDEVIKELFG